MFEGVRKKILGNVGNAVPIPTASRQLVENRVDALLDKAIGNSPGVKKIEQTVIAELRDERQALLGRLAELEHEEARVGTEEGDKIRALEAEATSSRDAYNAACTALRFARGEAMGRQHGLCIERADIMRQLEALAPTEIERVALELEARWNERAEQGRRTPMLDLAATGKDFATFRKATSAIRGLRFEHGPNMDSRLAELRQAAETILLAPIRMVSNA